MPNLNVTFLATINLELNARVQSFSRLEEVQFTLFTMKKNKAFDLDEITPNILKNLWETIKGDFMSTLLYFFIRILMLRVQNHTFLMLVPMKGATTTLGDYMPISYGETPCKLIAKLLANNLSTTLPNMIFPNKTTFLKNCKISNNISLVHEFDTRFITKNTSHQALISMDFTKIFDTVCWDAIVKTMELMCYDEIFEV